MLQNNDFYPLLLKVAAGDKKALEVLWNHTKDGLYTFILTYIHDRQLAEDALQETFLSIYKTSGSISRNINARAWVFTVARNHAISLLRKQKEPPSDSNEIPDCPDLSSFDTQVEQRDKLNRLLHQLDEVSRRIVLMHAVSDLKHREIAKILRIPLGTVYRKYSQSIKKLQKLYTVELVEEV